MSGRVFRRAGRSKARSAAVKTIGAEVQGDRLAPSRQFPFDAIDPGAHGYRMHSFASGGSRMPQRGFTAILRVGGRARTAVRCGGMPSRIARFRFGQAENFRVRDDEMVRLDPGQAKEIVGLAGRKFPVATIAGSSTHS